MCIAVIKGIAIDLQFTLVYLENFSLDGWFSLLNQGFVEVLNYLTELGHTFDTKKIKRSLRRVRNKYFTKYITGEDQQYFTEEILTETLARNNISLTSEELVTASQLYHTFEFPAWVPYTNINDTLKELSKKYAIGLITNSSEYVTGEILKLLDLEEYFGFIYNNARKPRLTAFKKFQEALQVPFEQLVMIGDDVTTDIIPAQQLGMKTIHSYRGYEYVQTHAKLGIIPDRKITQFQGVVEAVESLDSPY